MTNTHSTGGNNTSCFYGAASNSDTATRAGHVMLGWSRDPFTLFQTMIQLFSTGSHMTLGKTSLCKRERERKRGCMWRKHLEPDTRLYRP